MKYIQLGAKINCESYDGSGETTFWTFQSCEIRVSYHCESCVLIMQYLFLSSRDHLHREQEEQTETGINLTWVAYIFFKNVFIIIILRQNLTLCSPFDQELVTLSRLLLWQGYLTLSTGITKTGSSAEVFKNAFDLLSVKCWILLIVGLCLCLIYPTSKPGLLWILKYRILPQACEESAGRMETRTPHKIWKMMRANTCALQMSSRQMFSGLLSPVFYSTVTWILSHGQDLLLQLI